MSTNNHKDNNVPKKQLSDDEAFMQSLYDDLASVDLPIDEQPSNNVDKAILAAAHRAVESSPKLVIKKRTWYVPVVSAASVMLVFSLFFNQLDDLFVQSEMLQAPASISTQSNLEIFKKKEAREQEVNQQKTKRKQRQTKRISKQAKGGQVQQQASRLTVQNHLNPDNSFSIMADGETKEKTLVKAINLMTEKAYQHLLSVNSRWIFIKEEEEFYVIQIVSNKGLNTLYKLDKREYYINKSMQKIIKPRTLQELGLLSED